MPAMGTYRFKWPHQADEVIVTGTFDNWAKSIKLDNKGFVHEKTVEIPETKDDIFYKYVVNGQWRTDPSHAVRKDHEGNENNVLDPEDILPSATGAMMTNVAPGATTTGLAGAQPLEDKSRSLPGAFPEDTPSETGGVHTLQDRVVGVNPIPATPGMGNPVNLKPGEKVPDPSTLTSNTVQSTATTDKESYERGAGGAAYSPVGHAGGHAGHFGRPAASGSRIPEAGGMVMGGASGADPTVSSVGPTSSTAALAGQQPIEPRGTPQVVSKDASDSKDDGIAAKVAAGVGVAGVAAAGAAVAANELVKDKTGKDAVSALPQSTQNAINENAKQSNIPEQAGVKQSTATSTPASAVPTTTAQHTTATPPTPPTASKDSTKDAPKVASDSKDEGIAAKAAAGVGVAGVAAAGAAVVANESIKDKTGKDPAGALPQSTQDAINENAKQSNLPSQAGVGQSTTTGASSAMERDTASSVPTEVSESQKEAGQAPEAAANAEAVQEKSATEKELLSKVPESNAQGEPAPTQSAATATSVPAAGSSTGAATGLWSGAPAMLATTAPSGSTPEANAANATAASANSKSTGLPATLAGSTPSESTAETNAANATAASTSGPTTGLPATLAGSVPGESSSSTNAANATAASTTTSSTGAPQLGNPVAGVAPISMDDKATDSAGAAAKSTPTKPSVTTGVASSSTPQTSTAEKRQSVVEKLKNKATPENSAESSPSKASAHSKTDKAAKRRSFFGRLKDKLSS